MTPIKSTHCKDCGKSFDEVEKFRAYAKCLDCGKKYLRARHYEHYARRKTNPTEKKNPGRKPYTQNTKADCLKIMEACE